MIKQFIKTSITFAVLLMIAIPIMAKPTQKVINGLNYLLSDDMTAMVISDKKPYSGEIIIPSETVLKNKQYIVTAIDSVAFRNNTNLTSIIIPNTVTSIGVAAFYGCTGLTNITIPNSITVINAGTFYDCSSLTNVTIPNSVTSIDMCAFYGCSSLKNVTIPNSVTSIENYAFENCPKLDDETIRSILGIIASSYIAYEYNANGTATVVDAGDGDWKEFAVMNTRLLKIPETIVKNGKKYVVTKIAPNVFWDYAFLESVTIPNTVKEIGAGAFKQCNQLRNVILPQSLTHIENEVFSNCSELKTIEIPNTVTTIGEEAFFRSGLQRVVIPESVANIGKNAFCECKQLQSVIINGHLNSVGDYPFAFSDNLYSITFPSADIANANKPFFSKLTYDNRNRTLSIVLLNGESLTASKQYADLPQKIEEEFGKMYWVSNSAGGSNLVNEKGQVVLNGNNYDKIWFELPAIIVKKNGKYGAVSYTGKVIVNPIYQKYQGHGREYRMWFTNETSNGSMNYAISKTGTVLATKSFTNSQVYLLRNWLNDWFGFISEF